MERDKKDPFIEEVDLELRSIDSKLKEVFSKTEALLKEHAKETVETQDPDEKETNGV